MKAVAGLLLSDGGGFAVASKATGYLYFDTQKFLSGNYSKFYTAPLFHFHRPMFNILSIPNEPEFPEQMGTKFKFWFQHRSIGHILFKEGRPGTGETWAEKLACEFALMLGIPHAYYELAIWRGRLGVSSPSFVPSAGRLIHGNELLGGRATQGNDENKVNFYQERLHTATAVIGLLRLSQGIQPPQSYVQVGNLTAAVDVFVGYLLFDAWIGNQDRHSENWGLIRVRDLFYLAPSYDHGSSMARNLTDEERSHRLMTKDKGAAIDSFVTKARSALYPHAASSTKIKPFLTIEAFDFAWKARPQAGDTWLERLASIPDANIRDAIDQVPDQIMSSIAKDFTERLLILNRDRLLAHRMKK